MAPGTVPTRHDPKGSTMQAITRTTAMLAAVALAASGCAAQAAQAHDEHDRHHAPPGRAVAQEARAARNVVDVEVTGHAIDLPEQLAAGWTTFRFHNHSDEVHFGLLDLLPEGITVDDTVAEVVPVFQAGLDLINAGDPGAGFAEFAKLPAWYGDVVYAGGPGLVGPGETAATTVFLEPGTYVMECYVKSDGVFHTTHGMLAGFEVTDEETSVRSEPEADVTVTLSSNGSDSGEMVIDGDLRPGRQTIAVHFADQAVHGNVLGHDLHVGRVRADTDLDELGTWMSWITGLEGEAPVDFLGGAHDMPAGSTAYVEVTLTPGEYVFVAEVDDPASKGLLEVVTVGR